jgi:hypothetical protein
VDKEPIGNNGRRSMTNDQLRGEANSSPVSP